ncbi:MAG: DUF4332 domain-containing protein [Candidatus Wenzhouxiangella sp. M2_3B_020]
MAKVSQIEGIGPKLTEKLKADGVVSVEDLLTRAGSREGRRDLAASTGIEEKRLLRFVNHADLIRIKGVGGEYAELLEAAGVDSAAELARRNAANLHERMMEINQEKKLVRSVASRKQVEQWIAEAKDLPRAVHH